MESTYPEGFSDMLKFGLIEALVGRRSRRFFMGAEIPDGVFKYKSNFHVEPLTELEKFLVISACAGNTGWHHMIYRAECYAPYLSNYAGAARGRVFPSAAGFHTSVTFFTDDEGVYLLDNKNEPSSLEHNPDGSMDFRKIIEKVSTSIRKIDDKRLVLSSDTPHIEAHNTWVANRPGTLLVIPVGDLAQHVLLALCYMLQNNYVLYDDINKCSIPGIEKYQHIVNTNNIWPLTFVDQLSMSEMSTELSISCYSGALMLQAIGLGGWMFDGISPFSLLGASGDPEVPGLGFRFDEDERWPYPNPTGLEGVFEAHCPPHFSNIRAAVESVYRRKYGVGGPFNPKTPGPWKDSEKIRAAAEIHSHDFIECITLQAQYILDTFGKFPATVPSVLVVTYLQAHHLDLEFYDTFYKSGSYLDTHKTHMEKWHSK